MNKFSKMVEDKKWHHDFDRGGEGFSISLEDLDKVTQTLVKEFPNHITEGFDELLYLHEEREEWFLEWFGKSD